LQVLDRPRSPHPDTILHLYPMRIVSVLLVPVIAYTVCAVKPALAQSDKLSDEIARAVLPLPNEYRDGASVLGYLEDGGVETLRKGENDLTCLADDPSDDRFHVACYHASLEAFMRRGRELRSEGKERDEVQSIRRDEIQSGQLAFPEGPAALYSLTGPVEFVDGDIGDLSSLSALKVVYVPYATAESTGLSATPIAGEPWLMNAGEPWAHVMFYKPADEGN
jgi:hypothetical protein